MPRYCPRVATVEAVQVAMRPEVEAFCGSAVSYIPGDADGGAFYAVTVRRRRKGQADWVPAYAGDYILRLGKTLRVMRAEEFEALFEPAPTRPAKDAARRAKPKALAEGVAR